MAPREGPAVESDQQSVHPAEMCDGDAGEKRSEQVWVGMACAKDKEIGPQQHVECFIAHLAGYCQQFQRQAGTGAQSITGVE